MADVLSKGGLLSSWGRRSHACGSPRTGAGKTCSSAFCSATLCQAAAGPLKSSSGSCLYGRKVWLRCEGMGKPTKGSQQSVPIQMSLRVGKDMKRWKNGLLPNMKEIDSAQDLVDSLLNAGNKLLILDFFSPGCGGCKALLPKICQLAESNPHVQFLQISYQEHKSMCYSLNVHVLPFFRFYRGAQGHLCSFSCTNATIKKFKDALAKHSTERCSLGPARGLEESELMVLSANKDLCFTYTKTAEPVLAPLQGPAPVPLSDKARR